MLLFLDVLAALRELLFEPALVLALGLGKLLGLLLGVSTLFAHAVRLPAASRWNRHANGNPPATELGEAEAGFYSRRAA